LLIVFEGFCDMISFRGDEIFDDLHFCILIFLCDCLSVFNGGLFLFNSLKLVENITKLPFQLKFNELPCLLIVFD
jgi:hypothetical protein